MAASGRDPPPTLLPDSILEELANLPNSALHGLWEVVGKRTDEMVKQGPRLDDVARQKGVLRARLRECGEAKRLWRRVGVRGGAVLVTRLRDSAGRQERSDAGLLCDLGNKRGCGHEHTGRGLAALAPLPGCTCVRVLEDHTRCARARLCLGGNPINPSVAGT